LYILHSLKNNSFYVGSTINIEKRFIEHDNGYVKSTKQLRPLELKYFKKFDNIKEARQIEYKLKKLKSRKILQTIVQEQILKLTL